MLGIKTKSGSWRGWWLGYGIPLEAKERVVTFQADGDELNLFLEAMAASIAPLRGSHIAYTKLGGFQVHEPKTEKKLSVELL